MTQQTSRHVESVVAALRILDCFRSNDALTLKELAGLTGFTHNRILRLAGTLQAMDYLVRDPGSGAFSLGAQVLFLGKMAERRLNLPALARPVLKELVAKTGESTSLYVQDHKERVVLLREEGTKVIRYSMVEGQRLPLYAGAAGKVILAFGPAGLAQELIGQGALAGFTPTTITDPGELARQLELIRARGYAISLGERNVEAASVAAPVFNLDNALAGALSLAGPASRLDEATLDQLSELVVEAARDLSRRLGSER